MKARTGDWIVIEPSHVGGHRRRGLVLEVRGADGAPPYRVRWSEDDQESLVFPGEGAHVVDPGDIERYTQG
jgi:hypothetical protein